MKIQLVKKTESFTGKVAKHACLILNGNCEQERIRVSLENFRSENCSASLVKISILIIVRHTREYDGHTRIYARQILFISCSYAG